MEGSYSVQTNNRFAFFMDEEDDPGDMILKAEGKVSELISPKTTENSPSQKKNDKPPKGKDQKPLLLSGKKPQGDQTGGKRQINDRGQQPNNRSNENRPPRDNKRPFTSSTNTKGGDTRPFRQNRGGGRGRLPSREKQDGGEKIGGSGGTSGADDVIQRDARSRPRWSDRNNGEGRGRQDREDGGERNGGFRSSRPPRGGFRGGKREFERRSGNDKTSVKPFDKKEGAGSHNWGSVKDDINTSGGGNGEEWPNDDGEQTEITPEQKQELSDENIETDKAPVESQPDETVQEKEEEQFTLDEYKAKQEKKRLVPVFKERKPGENEDSTRWKDTFVYERTDSELVPGTREIVEKYKSSGRVKTAVESSFFFKETSRFGRGGGPGKRGGMERRQFDDKQGRQFEERQGRQFDDKQGQDEHERRPRRTNGEQRSERRPRRYDDDHRSERRGGGGVNRAARDRSKFNVEDEKDFPSLGTVSA